MRRLKISAISYLNTAPLMWDFEHGRPAAEGDTLSAEHFEISYTIPSRCAEALRVGSADIGIIPAVTYATIPDLVILPDATIAAKGPVRSILLVSKTPLEQITTIAADTSSRSSVALADVLFRKFLGGARQFTPMAPDLDAMLRRCDAALLIGDPALRVNSAGISPASASRPQTSPSPVYHLFDLAELWQQHTGKPFVFAFWAVRMAALADARPDLDLAAVFRHSRDHGLKPDNIDRIARAWASRTGIAESEIQRYLARHIHYHLDDECLQGLELFYQYAAEYALIPAAPELRFLGASACLVR